MISWILIVGYKGSNLEQARKDWRKFNVQLEAVDTASEAVAHIPFRKYLAVIVSYGVSDIAPLIEYMDDNNQIPLVILSRKESGIRFAGSIISGANKFLIDPNRLIESIRENKGISDKITKLPPYKMKSLGVLAHKDILMLVDYRKVFVHGADISLTTSEFEILQLLLSEIGRVFTYEQIYTYAYGEDVDTTITKNSVRCHIARLRQRLRTDHQTENYIDSVRSIGYRIAI